VIAKESRVNLPPAANGRSAAKNLGKRAWVAATRSATVRSFSGAGDLPSTDEKKAGRPFSGGFIPVRSRMSPHSASRPPAASSSSASAQKTRSFSPVKR
jgi:hypothetical protein